MQTPNHAPGQTHDAPEADNAAKRQELDYDPLDAAITVLGNVKIEDPSSRMDTEDAHNRVNLALEYLRIEKERRNA